MRQDLVAAGHHGDRHAELGVRVDELGAGHAGPDDDEVFGQLVEVVELAPVEDAFAVGLRAAQYTRAGASGDEYDIGLDLADRSIVLGDLDGVCSHARHIVDQLAAAGDQRHALVAQPFGNVGGLRGGQGLDTLVDLRQRDLGVLEFEGVPEVGRSAQLGTHACRCDQGLGRHAVPQHARAADAVGVDDGDLGDLTAASGSDERRLIARGATADDHDAGCHGFNASQAGG